MDLGMIVAVSNTGNLKIWNAMSLELVSSIDPANSINKKTPLFMSVIAPNICIAFSDGSIAVIFAFPKNLRKGGLLDEKMKREKFMKNLEKEKEIAEKLSGKFEFIDESIYQEVEKLDYYNCDCVDSEEVIKEEIVEKFFY
jgi:hypothetical protein